MANQYSSNIFLLYTIGSTIYGVWMLYTFLAVVVPREISAPMVYFAVLGPLLRIVGVTVQWLIWERKREGVSQVQQEMMRVEIDNRIGFMQAMYPIIMSAAVGARLILSLLVGSCSKSSLDPVHTLCNNYSDQGGISLSLTIELMFIPIVTFCLLRDTRFEALLASWFINGAILISYGVILSSADITVAIILYLFFSTLIYADSQSRLVKTSGLVNRLQDSLAENERLAVEAQAIELRAMIGNIAHDLKSPLTSFLSGLECVLEVVSTWEQQLNVNHEQFMSRAYSNLNSTTPLLSLPLYLPEIPDKASGGGQVPEIFESKFGGEEGDLDLECGMKGGSKGAAVGIAIAAAQSQPQSLGRARVPSFYHQYVVAVSANSDNDTVEEALRAGADSFIEKPFTYDCFQQVMQNKTPPPYPV
eukprot:gene22472-25460_t